MAYCTLDDIVKKRISEEDLIGLTDDYGDGVLDAEVVSGAIAEADELIDGYLRTRDFELPLATVPGVLRRLSAAIATYLLYGRRPHLETPERVKNDYTGALKTLEKIQRGEIQIGAGEPATEAPGTLQTSAPEKLFGSDTLDKY